MRYLRNCDYQSNRVGKVTKHVRVLAGLPVSVETKAFLKGRLIISLISLMSLKALNMYNYLISGS